MSWWERQWYKMLGGPVTVGGALRGSTVTADNLTAGRVPIVGTAGLLQDDADLTFSGDTLSGTNVTSSGTVQGATVKATNLTSGRVVLAGTGGALTDDADLSFATATNTLSSTVIKVTGLTSGNVVFTGTGGQLSEADAGEFAWNNSTKVLSANNGTFSGNVTVTTQGRFGGATNYANFDDTGHLTFAGTGKPWNDVRIEPVARTTGATAPSFEKWFDDGAGSQGVYLYSFDDAAAGSEKQVFFTLQMPHDWDAGDIHIHVHWIPNISQNTATPRWLLEYTWAEPGAVYGNTAGKAATSNEQGDANLTAYKHYITEFTALSPGATTNGLSTILIGRLCRTSANAADTYTTAGNKCGLLYLDAHYQLDSLGSTDEYTK